MTNAQLQALKAAIEADAALMEIWGGPKHPSDKADAIARELNEEAPAFFWVWRTSVTKREITEGGSLDPDGVTVRSWNWTGNGFISRSAGEIAAWQELFNHAQVINPSLTNVRQAFQDILSGVGNAASNRAHMANVCRRLATRAEKVLATGGTGNAASPATMGFEGALRYQDILDAMAS